MTEPILNFSTLKTNYNPDKRIGGECSSYEHQCAMKMGTALRKSGFTFQNYTDLTCKNNDGMSVPRSAQSLAKYLREEYKRPIYINNPSNASKALSRKQGIVFYQNLNGADIDHIDLWDRDRAIGDDYSKNCKKMVFFPLNDNPARR